MYNRGPIYKESYVKLRQNLGQIPIYAKLEKEVDLQRIPEQTWEKVTQKLGET